MASDEESLIREIQSVKMLLMLQLLGQGFKQKHLALALGVSDATLSRMLPKGFSSDLPNVVRVGGAGDKRSS